MIIVLIVLLLILCGYENLLAMLFAMKNYRGISFVVVPVFCFIVMAGCFMSALYLARVVL